MKYSLYLAYTQLRAVSYRLTSVTYLTRKAERLSRAIEALQSQHNDVSVDAYDRLADHECDIYQELRRRGIITL